MDTKLVAEKRPFEPYYLLISKYTEHKMIEGIANSPGSVISKAPGAAPVLLKEMKKVIEKLNFQGV